MIDETDLTDITNTLQSLAEKIEVERIWFAVSIGMIAICPALPTNPEIAGLVNPMRVFFGVAGTVFGALLFFEWVYAFNDAKNLRRTKIDIIRLKNNLQPIHHTVIPEPESEPAQPVTPPLTVFNTTDHKHYEVKRYEHPATLEFLLFLFQSANGNGRIPSEPAIASAGKSSDPDKSDKWKSTDSDVWLTQTDEQGITEKIFPSKTGNAPRRIRDGMTFEKAAPLLGHDSESVSQFLQNQA